MIFAPSHKHFTTEGSSTEAGSINSLQDDNVELALDIYTPSERREYLVKRGNDCHPRSNISGNTSGAGSAGGGSGLNALNDVSDEDDTGLMWYDVLSRYDALMSASASTKNNDKDDSSTIGKESTHNGKGSTSTQANAAELERTAIELFKFCVLYNGDGHAYWGWDEQLLVPFRDVINVETNYAVVALDNVEGVDKVHDFSALGDEAAGLTSSSLGGQYIHESFLSISPYTPAKSELSAMIRLLLETSDDKLTLTPLVLPRELHRLIVAKEESNIGITNNDASTGEDNDLGGSSNDS